MCRLLLAVASAPVRVAPLLLGAPRSLAVLSADHPDGWGIAVHDASHGLVSSRTGSRVPLALPDAAFRIERGLERAGADERFHAVAQGARGTTILAHVRAKTMGATALANTHPFQKGRWVFAHNGTIHALSALERRVPAPFRADVRGETDSELFFAFLRVHLDRVGRLAVPADDITDGALRRAIREATAIADFGATNFALTDGDTTYIHRLGRGLFVDDSTPGAVYVASECLGPGGAAPWRALEEGVLVRIDRHADRVVQTLVA